MKLSIISIGCIAVFSVSINVGYAHAMNVDELLAQNEVFVKQKNKVECMRRVLKIRKGYIGSTSIMDSITVLRQDFARRNC